MKDNKLLQALLRPMPGLLSSDDFWSSTMALAFDSTAVACALPDLNDEGDAIWDDVKEENVIDRLKQT